MSCRSFAAETFPSECESETGTSGSVSLLLGSTPKHWHCGIDVEVLGM
ncbi:hypothetical protein HMPREF1861_00946 [Corynebacterium kroppenstedtii]|nr:hypothetical protein HMPREF1861_00946 [Corynebacterium kroppenstedtii]